MGRIKQDLEKVWHSGCLGGGKSNNDNNKNKDALIKVGQNVEVTMRDRRSLPLRNSLRRNWEEVVCAELRRGEARRGIKWWRILIWKHKSVRRNNVAVI
jgi:hypothetical protein